MEYREISALAKAINQSVASVIVGKETETELILAALLSGGHVLLEDVPGTGKTTLAKSLARSLDCAFSRVQFTPDLLPSDVTGMRIYNQKSGEFTFIKGPVFTNILLADEINRATPRTQSPFWSSPRKTRWKRRAPSPCPKRSWTASSSVSPSVTPREKRPSCSCSALWMLSL